MIAWAIVGVIATLAVFAQGDLISEEKCEIKARTTAGWVCGASRPDINGNSYASFQNVPYAQQPLGELRFKELQPPEPWDGLYDATKVGPICPQIDTLYGALITNTNMSEACIHGNIYAPMSALAVEDTCPGLSVLIFIHGGGFASGSGDPDVFGPEYLVAEGVIVFTFNYRLGALGYLSLNSSSIPGNNGLKDALTFCRWVKANARNFGGNPDDITIVGQSSGGATAHLLVLSGASKGLFKRAMLISGVATRGFYSPSPKYAQVVANSFISKLGIKETDPEEIHSQLINMPLDKIMNATALVMAEFTLVSFCPVVEQQFPGVTTVLDDDPETLLLNGRGKDIPLLIGFNNLEGEFLIPNVIKFNITGAVQQNPLLMLSPDLVYKLTDETALNFAEQTEDKYFNGEPTPEKYIQCAADYGFAYPGIKSVELRAAVGGAPAYLYQFSYNADFSVIKVLKGVDYVGASHIDDLTFILRPNSMKGYEKFDNPTSRDLKMRKYMLRMVKNFMTCNNPTCDADDSLWPAQSSGTPGQYENILEPDNTTYSDQTAYQQDMVMYYDALYSNVQ